ncbi:MAG: hypothetical protein CSA35_05130 [Dethiosulfovibrio peptidovorans]|nr:MAG: hypothetical protein CSA35_05130 [Dethiosulfovibrio peptidovorans]
MQSQKIEEWGIQYIERYSIYQEFVRRMKNLIQDLIEREGVNVYALNGWAKSPEKFLKDLSGSRTSLPADPFKDISDLATVKILLYFPSDVAMVEKTIQEEFLIDLPRSTTSKDLEDPDLFGYRSIVYDVSLKSDRSGLKEWEKYRDLKLHVQVRTMLQEAWAAISPEIAGVTDAVTKGKLKRKLSRVSALLEEADEDFHYLRETAQSLSVPVAPEQGAPIFESESPQEQENLSREGLKRIFMENDEAVYTEWIENAQDVGFPVYIPGPSDLDDSLDDLFRILQAAEISTMNDVRVFLTAMKKGNTGLEQLKTVYSAFEESIETWKVDGYSAVFLVVLNSRWDILQNKDLVALGIKTGSDRIKGQ